jgi:hypothetical protein
MVTVLAACTSSQQPQQSQEPEPSAMASQELCLAPVAATIGTEPMATSCPSIRRCYAIPRCVRWVDKRHRHHIVLQRARTLQRVHAHVRPEYCRPYEGFVNRGSCIVDPYG